MTSDSGLLLYRIFTPATNKRGKLLKRNFILCGIGTMDKYIRLLDENEDF